MTLGELRWTAADGFSARARLFVLALLCAVTLPPARLVAQTIGINAGASQSTVVLPNGRISVPVIIDLTSAGAANIASLESAIGWNAAGMVFDSIRVNALTGWAFSANLINAGLGSVVFNSSNATALPATSTLATAFFTAGAFASGFRVTPVPSSAGDALGQDIMSLLRTRALDVCVAVSGRWGDVTDETNVNIVDAQQIARFSVGLTVANANALSHRGDVTADGNINIIDAQQIARFSVGLSAAPRTNTNAFVPPVITSIVVAPGTPQTIGAAGNVRLAAIPRDAGNADRTGCSSVTWASSNPAIATVVDGFVTGIALGSATITATSVTQPAVSASVLVNVGAPGAPASVAFSGSGQTILDQATSSATTATVRDGNGAPLPATPVTYASRSAAIATVNAAGTITGVSRGQAVIVVSVTGSPGIADSLLAIVRSPGAPVLVSSFTRFSVKKDTVVNVSFFVNMGSSPTSVGSGNVTITWNPAVLTFVQQSGLYAGFVSMNTTNAASGSLKVAFANPTGNTGNIGLVTLTFLGGSSIGSVGDLTFTSTEISTTGFASLFANMVQVVQPIIVR